MKFTNILEKIRANFYKFQQRVCEIITWYHSLTESELLKWCPRKIEGSWDHTKYPCLVNLLVFIIDAVISLCLLYDYRKLWSQQITSSLSAAFHLELINPLFNQGLRSLISKVFGTCEIRSFSINPAGYNGKMAHIFWIAWIRVVQGLEIIRRDDPYHMSDNQRSLKQPQDPTFFQSLGFSSHLLINCL